MITQVSCENENCHWCTDLDSLSETNPKTCPICGCTIINDYTGEEYC